MYVYTYIYIYIHWFGLLLVMLICWFVYIRLFTIRGAAENLYCFARSLLAYISFTWITAAYVMSSEAYHACVHMTRKRLPVWEQKRTNSHQIVSCMFRTYNHSTFHNVCSAIVLGDDFDGDCVVLTVQEIALPPSAQGQDQD